VCYQHRPLKQKRKHKLSVIFIVKNILLTLPTLKSIISTRRVNLGVLSVESIYKKIHETIIEVWRYDIKSDYNQYFLLREDTLKNALYFHIRNRLGDAFMKDNHLAIFTEYKIDTNETIDLVVVKLDIEKAKDNKLKDCVKEIIAIVEIKYKNQTASENIFINDVKKILNYTNKFKFEYTKFFLAFIIEKYFYEE